MRFRLRHGVAAALAAALGACGAQAPEPAAAGKAAAPVGAGASGVIPGTPAGGLRDWVTDIRRGTADLPARAAVAPGEAQRQALELYIGRQEYIELYYGPGGRRAAGEALGAAVEEAEARFHELLQLLGTPRPDPSRVSESVAALAAQLERVVVEARAAGVPVDEPVVAPGGAS